MQKRNGKLIFAPRDLIVFFASGFASWMDRLHLEGPGRAQPDEDDPGEKLAAELGNRHEQAAVTRYEAERRRIWKAEKVDFPTALEATKTALREGPDILYQPALAKDDFEGYADFLLRVERPSDLGAFSYEVADTKLARTVRPYFLLQLCAYAEMLEALQGVRPDQIRVITGDAKDHLFKTNEVYGYYLAQKDAFRKLQDSFDPDQPPLPDPRADHGRWQGEADRMLARIDHPARVAGISRRQIARLAEASVATMSALAAREPELRCPGIEPPILARLTQQARLQIGSKDRDAPAFELLPPAPDRPSGLLRLPPASTADAFLDFEGYPFAEGGLEYLTGLAIGPPGSPLMYGAIWAHDDRAERQAFEALIDRLLAARARDPGMHIYHYADYERAALRRLAGKHGTREDELDLLLREERLVDLYTIVRQSIRAGVARYSLKEIERLYRPARAEAIRSGLASVAEYGRYLDLREEELAEAAQILSALEAYNRADVDSTRALSDWLRSEQARAGLAWVPPSARAPEVEPPTEDVREADALAAVLLAEIPADRGADPERWRIQELLAQLLTFHRREDRPTWWAVFDALEKDDEALIDDRNCLGGLARTGRPPEPQAKSRLYEYRFDPDQETKLTDGSRCIINQRLPDDGLWYTTIHSLDEDQGLVTIKLGPKSPPPPDCCALIPCDVVPTDSLVASLLRTAQVWQAKRQLPGPIATLLARDPPRIRDRAPGTPIVASDEDLIPALVDRIARLDDSLLAIQGPPGTGKTRAAAQVIAELAARGLRIAVSAHSHAVINHLLGKTFTEMARRGLPTDRVIKINGETDGPFARLPNLEKVDLTTPGPRVTGGTPWVFSKPAAAGQFDVLFVDEAGQMTLANVVAIAPAAPRVVLLGDPMQLDQPTKGTHPGESGNSALRYLLGDRATIPEDRGVFLARTHRLHPEICVFISDAIYERRLEAQPGNERRVIRARGGEGGGGASRDTEIDREAGIVFVPVAHEGNVRESEEEAHAIAEIIEGLIGRERTDEHGASAGLVRAEDILVVAPYNAQVRRLRSVLAEQVRVGTVDRFQGQQAPIVIVSMCMSGGEMPARGVEFLFSPNRLNVAISRAESLAIVVGHPGLAGMRVGSVEQMRRVGLWARVCTWESERISGVVTPAGIDDTACCKR